MGGNARLEQMWAPATTHTIVWPAGVPDTERLASACAEVAASARPGSYVSRRVGDASDLEGVSPWRFLDRCRHRFVTARGEDDLDAFVAALSADRPDPVLPFSFVVCPGGLAMVHSHELGDGSVSAALLEAVLRVYDGGPGTPRVPDRVARDRDLARALGSLWLRRPRAVVDAAAGIARRYRRRPAMETVAAAVVTSAVRTETWAPDDEDMAAVARWRRSVPARPSLSTALLWTVARALAAHGCTAGPQPWQIVVGIRGGAPALTGFGGNLVGRALVDVDPHGDPSGPSGQLRRQSASGEILAMHLAKAGAGAAAGWVRRGRVAEPGTVRIGTSPGLSWSDRGRHAFGAGFVATVPRAASGPPRAYTFVTPFLPGIGVNVNWVGERPGVVLSFGALRVGDGAVDAVLASLRGGVAALLDDGATDPGPPVGAVPAAVR